MNVIIRSARSRSVLKSSALLSALSFWMALPGQAAVVTWTGGSASGNWSAGANWDSGSAPANNDSLVFNAAVGAGSITNNLNGRTFAQISFIGVGGSFFVHGNPITLTGGISQSSSGGANTVHLDITLANNNQTFSVTGSGIGSGLQISGDINLNGRNLTVNVTDSGTELNLSGVVSGNGNITRGTGLGGLRFSGSSPNTYNGNLTVNGGYVFAVKPNGITSIPGNATVGNGTGLDRLILGADDQLGSGAVVTLEASGLLDNNNETNTVGGITFDGGGTVESTTGRIVLAGPVTVIGSGTSNAVINGNLHLGSATRLFDVSNTPQTFDLIVNGVISGGVSGGFPFFAAGLTKAGDGVLRLNAENTYLGPTTVNDGILRVHNDGALGATFSLFGSAATFVNSNAVLLLNDAHITNEVLTLNSSATGGALQNELTADWIGDVILSRDVIIEASSAFSIGGQISGPGGFTKIGGSVLTLFGTNVNTYAGTTRVNAGTLLLDGSASNGSIPGNLVIGDGIGTDTVRLAGLNQIVNTARITINSSGLFDLDGFADAVGSLVGTGDVELGSATMNIGFNDEIATFNGVISGSGGINKFTGTTGTQIFNGTNTYTGTTTINGGTLIVNGPQSQSSVVIGANGTLGGTGAVGVIHNALGGVISPGNGGPGSLSSSNVFLGAGSEVVIDISGTAFADYDTWNVNGTNTLAGALTVNVSPAFAPVEGRAFTILNNDGLENLTGTFAGLPNNSILTAGIHRFRINYTNDIVLTFTDPALDPIVSTITSGNGNGTIDANECNLLHLVVTNTSGVNLSSVSAVLWSETEDVVVTQPESPYLDIPANGRGTNLVPFQISTLPSFACAGQITLRLIVTTSSGSFGTFVNLPTGSPGSPVRFNNNVNFAIPDTSSVTSAVVVSGITTPVKKVTVSLNLSHTATEDLDIALRAPDGTIINLSSDNGGTADDYGTDCVDGARTVFDDAAPTSITAGAAPFVGTFRPEQALSAFIGMTGSNVNGTWRLIINDDSGGAVGTLRCWSLFISPTECSPGGGECSTCPGLFTGSLSIPDGIQTGRLTREGFGSTCASPKDCPGLEHALARNYNVYNFTNESSSAQCVYMSIHVHDAEQTFIAAYLGSFNPANPCDNYLADPGFSTSGTVGGSFIIPANSAFAIAVSQVDAGSASTNYTLVVSGLECRPVLDIDPLAANRVRVHWPTSAAGYQLEASDILPGSAWWAITNVPSVIDGRYSITNQTTTSTNLFYRLNRPTP